MKAKTIIIGLMMLTLLLTLVNANIPETYIKDRTLTIQVIENTGELENYTIEDVTAFYKEGWNITITMDGSEPEMELPIYKKDKDGNKTKKGKAIKKSNPEKTKINIKTSGHEIIHIGNQSLILNITEDTTLENNSVNDVFILKSSGNWMTDTTTTWAQTINDSHHPGVWNTLDSIAEANNSHGTVATNLGVVGTPTFSTGRHGNCMNGHNSNYLSLDWIDTIPRTDIGTVEFWVNITSFGGGYTYPFQFVSSGVMQVRSFISSGGLLSVQHGITPFTAQDTIDIATIELNKWYHVAFTWNTGGLPDGSGNTMKAWLNGVLTGTPETNTQTNTTNPGYASKTIGNAAGSSNINGCIDNFKITYDNRFDFTDRWLENSSVRSINYPSTTYLVAHEAGYTILDASKSQTENIWWESLGTSYKQIFGIDGNIYVDNTTQFVNNSFNGDTFTQGLTRKDNVFITPTEYFWTNSSGWCRDDGTVDFTYACDLAVEKTNIQDITGTSTETWISNGTNTIEYNSTGEITKTFQDGNNVTALTIANNSNTLFAGTYNGAIQEIDTNANQLLRSWTAPTPTYTSLSYGSLLVGTLGGVYLYDITATNFTACVMPLTVYQLEDTLVKVNWTMVTNGDPSAHCTNCPEIFGEISQHGDNITQISIGSTDTYYNITGFTHNLTHNVNLINNYAFNISYDGIYKWEYSMSFGGGANSEYIMRVARNGNGGNHTYSHRVIGSGGDVGNAGAGGMEALSKGDIITFQIADHEAPAQDVFIDTANLNINKIGELNNGDYTVQISEDNTTWTDFKYVYVDKGYASTPGLKNNTLYYIKGSNSTCNSSILTITTAQNGGNTVNDAIVILAIALTFVYLVVYIKNRLFGNIAFMIAGVSIMAYSTDTTIVLCGSIVLLGAVISLVYDMLRKRLDNSLSDNLTK